MCNCIKPTAYAILNGGTNNSATNGAVYFYQNNGYVTIRVSLYNIPQIDTVTNKLFEVTINRTSDCATINGTTSTTSTNTIGTTDDTTTTYDPNLLVPLIAFNKMGVESAEMTYNTDNFTASEIIGSSFVVRRTATGGDSIACGAIAAF